MNNYDEWKQQTPESGDPIEMSVTCDCGNEKKPADSFCNKCKSKMNTQEKLTDESPMPIGKRKGTPMKDIDAHYLIAFKHNVPPNKNNQAVHDYINDNFQVLLKEAGL